MRSGKWQCPICYWQKFDCAAYDSGICIALSSTYFKRGRCPFYKSKKQVMAERAKEREKKE